MRFVQMRRLLHAPNEASHLKPVWDHLSKALSVPLARSKRDVPEWPLGLVNTMQMAQQLLGRVLFRLSEVQGSGNDQGTCLHR